MALSFDLLESAVNIKVTGYRRCN